MSHPLVVHLKKSPYDVCVDRTSIWGNPARIGPDGPRAHVIAQYEIYLKSRPDLVALIPGLRGKVLGCWCAPKPCHGDVLARLANE